MNATLKLTIAKLLQKISRNYPFYSGCGTLANSFVYKMLFSNHEPFETTIRDGTRIKVHPNDYVGRSIYFFGDLDPKISWLCQKILRPGDCMLDIGANYGLVSLLSARLVGAKGAVHAFEPQGSLASLIRESADLNGFKHLTVHPIGLSSQDSQAQFFVPDNNRGMGSVSRHHEGAQVTTIELKAASTYLENLKLSKVRLIKIDVEGHEYEILKASFPWLMQVRPQAIIFENNQKKDVLQKPIDLLEQLGYGFYGLSRSLLRVSLYETDVRGAYMYNDILAIDPFCELFERVKSGFNLKLQG